MHICGAMLILLDAVLVGGFLGWLFLWFKPRLGDVIQGVILPTMYIIALLIAMPAMYGWGFVAISCGLILLSFATMAFMAPNSSEIIN